MKVIDFLGCIYVCLFSYDNPNRSIILLPVLHKSQLHKNSKHKLVQQIYFHCYNGSDSIKFIYKSIVPYESSSPQLVRILTIAN